jgi:NAD(P)-dependent dehydrogenase (short-subunit alcohol dehydrogenase family)
MRFEGKTAVVTGGNSGIGLAIAKSLKEEGARVAIFGRNPDSLASAVQELGDGSISVQGDVSQSEDLDRLYSEVDAKFGKVDVLVANAGIGEFVPLDAADEAHFSRVVDVNFKGVFFTVQKAVPYLNEGASVVLTSSALNQMGWPGASVYSATKAAVRSLARTFSAELIGRGIRVNSLSPGPIETPIFDKLGLPQADLDGFKGQITEQSPISRFGQPNEMAKAALFLASDDSSYVVGADLVADGGLSQI